MKEGDQVIVSGTVDVYERDGRYQLYADRIIQDDIGLLNARYEELKRRLEESGMFDEIYKKPIPRYIKTLGVVTASTGAAIRDIINISTRRNPFIQIILYPAIVQGQGAAPSICRGIETLDRYGVDVIIIGRGGGSLEDLWAFNEESVAEAVFACRTPIISAVGHETDTVISDYVADLRAPTPSAAAELAVFSYDQFQSDLEAFQDRLDQKMGNRIISLRRSTESLRRELVHLSPAARVRDRRMFTAQLEEKLLMAMERKILEARRQADVGERLQNRMDRKLSEAKNSMRLYAAGLERRSPIARLSGGYGYVSDESGKTVTSVQQVKAGEIVKIRLSDGRMEATVNSVQPMLREQGGET
jgi:exodeoxyribonuclease VII large subunit